MSVSSPAAVLAGHATSSSSSSVRRPVPPGARPDAPVRVGISHSSRLVSAGLQAMLAPHRERVVPVSNSQTPDVELVDVSVVDPTELAQGRPAWPRIALLWDCSPRSVYRAELMEASCSVPINADARELVVAIERAHRRQPARPAHRTVQPVLPVGLSPREAQILSRICAGKSNEDIGREMYLSINTIKTYVRTAYRKIGVTSRTQAVLWGLDHGF